MDRKREDMRLACTIGDVHTVKRLITDRRQCVDVNVNLHLDVDGSTPLYIACRCRSTEVVRYFLTLPECQVNRISGLRGRTPLHVVCSNWYTPSMTIVELLLAREDCDPNVKDSDGNTPLILVCDRNMVAMHGCDKIVQLLLSSSKCDPNVRNKVGDTPLHLTATRQGHTQIIQLLLAHPQCDPNVTNYRGEIPLHVACEKGNAGVVKTLLATGKCAPTIQTTTGDTPLHLATRIEDTPIIELLLADPRCDPNVANNQGEIPLHVACEKGNAIVVKTLLATGKNGLNVQTKTGDTPLHLAAGIDNTQIIQLLLADPQCAPNITNNRGETPLHVSCGQEQMHYATIKVLVSCCDPNLPDRRGNTPLHLACIHGSLQIIQLLLSSGKVDPECVNTAGKTPVELAGTNYQIIQVVNLFTENKHKHPIETFVKIFIIGNAETGKSTLIQAICAEASNTIFLKVLPTSRKQVKPEDVEPHTAGIIPRRFRSKHFGNTVLYDFAGQHEYYSSHAAVVENVAVPTPPAFIVVVDISEPIDQITEKLTYWWSFIENHCKRTSVPPPVILVGSHKDIIKARKENVEERMKLILQSLGGIPTTFNFAGHVAIDCRRLVSKGLDSLISLLNESCKCLRKTSDVDLRCHVLYAFLTDKFQSSIACKLSDLITIIQKEDTLLPQSPADLEHLLSTLSDKGQVLLLKNTSNPEDSWIVLQREKLLSEVNGSIFAPDNFRQHVKDFAKSTGVVPRSKIEQQFRQYPLDIVIGFLSHLEFCFKIEDYQTLDMIAGEWKPQIHPTSPSDQDEEFYFFPALVRVEYPTDVWKQPSTETHTPADPPMTFQCGWFYQCSLPNQFLTSRFLHVLILRLAFRFALAVDRHSDQSPVIQRRCSVWKHGIAWLHQDGIGTVVEVGLQCRWVTVMMRCSSTRMMECAQLQSSVIKTILDTRADFSHAVVMVQSLIDPKCLQYRMEERTRGGIVQYTFKEVAAAVIKGKPYTIDQSGTTMIELIKLLPFEPYLGVGEGVINKLFKSEYAEREVTNNDLTELAEKTHKRVELFREVVEPVLNPSLFHDCCRQNTDNPISLCKSLFKLFRDQGNGTFRDFEQHLSKYSVFSGQNPLELAGIAPSDQDSPIAPSGLDTHMGDHPTMVELVRFRGRERRINIPQEISTKYYQFGVLLLDDSTGARMEALDHKHLKDSEQINMDVLQQWIDGKGKIPVTWRTLVDVLHDVQLTNLAADIEEVKQT